MKKYISVCLAISLALVFASIAMAGTNPGTGIQGSKHDLSFVDASLMQAGDTRICIFCHTPHFAAKPANLNTTVGQPINYYPLWNHNTSVVTSYLTYTNGLVVDPTNPTNPMNLNATLDPNFALGPGGVSKLCLSCHDGSVAMNAYGNFNGNPDPGLNNAAKTMAGMPGGAGFIIGDNVTTPGTSDLSNHHPIGFSYMTAYNNDTGLNDPSTPINGNSAGLSIGDVLWGGNVECVSCHSVHNRDNDGSPFLWADDKTGSQLCLSCHYK